MEQYKIHGDNQQERLTDLAWVAGFIDGEGSFVLRKSAQKPPRRSANDWRVVAEFSVTNTAYSSIQNVYNILQRNGVGAHLWERKYSDPRNMNNMHLIVSGMKRVKKLIELLLPYSVTKKREMQTILEYINYRMEQHFAPYTNKDIEIISKLHELKKTYDR